MILSRLSDYLRRHRRASVAQLSVALAASPDALRAMLARLEHKGRVRRLPPPKAACGNGCCRCEASTLELYGWIDDADEPPPAAPECAA